MTRKTKDVWYIETNYGYGWEQESAYDSYDEAKADYGEYAVHMAHYGGRCRIKARREAV